MDTAYGYPIVTAENVFDVLKELGVTAWRHIAPITTLEEYRQGNLSENQRAELRFAPTVEVLTLQGPEETFRGFRTVGRNWTTVFALLPDDLVPLIGEYKHGTDEILLVPPSGVPSRTDLETGDPMSTCAKREWEEETGLQLKYVLPLQPKGLAIAGRQSSVRYFPYLGEVEEPIVRGASKLDANEKLAMVLMPLQEWLRAIDHLPGMESSGVTTTYLALRHLGRI